MKDSSLYSDGEEVLAELGVKLVVFPPSKAEELRGGRAEGHEEEAHCEGWDEGQEGQVGEKMGVLKDADSRIFQPLSWGCIGWRQAPPNRLRL